MTLSHRIRYAMDRAGLSQTELADRAGVTRGTVSNWVNGRSASVKTSVVGPLAKALNVSAVWLMDGRGDIDSPPPADVPEDALVIAKILTRLVPQQRELIDILFDALDTYVNGEEPESKDKEEPPGAETLIKAYQILDSAQYRDRFAALPPEVKGNIVATFCAILNDEQEEDPEGVLDATLKFYKHYRA